MSNEITSATEMRMKKSMEAMHTEFSRLRTGRAQPSLLELVKVDYYGTMTPLQQVANINIEDARTLTVTPWEKPMIPVIEKAIRMADLGLNPVTSGLLIRVPLPALNEERRRELVRVVRDLAEKAKVSLRNIRRDSNAELKVLNKEKIINDDELRRAEESMQKLTDRFVSTVDKELAEKETDLLTI